MQEIRFIFRLSRPYAAVQVEAKKGKGRPIKYIIASGSTDSPLCLAKADTLLFPLSENESVSTADGAPITPSGKFYRTVETIDPYHLIFDILDQQVLDRTGDYLKG